MKEIIKKTVLGLDIVKKFANKTEEEYVNESLNEIKERYLQYPEVYYDFMRDMFSGKDNPTIEECEANAKRQFAKNHQQYVNMLLGFKENGELFYLDRKEKVVYFMFNKRKGITAGRYLGLQAFVHYNPTNVDVIELAINDEAFFEGIENRRYNVSTDDGRLIEELHLLIEKNTTH